MNTNEPSKQTAGRHFEKVALSLADICGSQYVRAICANRSFLTGTDSAELTRVAFEKIEFLPEAFERRLAQLLARVGQRACAPFDDPASGASTRQFDQHSKLGMAPMSALGYVRVGEDGKLYLITKSEHYHAPLGHSFPGYALLDVARRLGIPNATHNNTRGYITRMLEQELVCAANNVDSSDAPAVKALLASSSPDVMNRVLNLETGSLAVEAALKLILARFYRSEASEPLPKFSGRLPVILVMGNDDGGLKANYHGTTLFTQMMRGMWPELASPVQEQCMRVVPIRPNNMADLESAFRTYESGKFKIAGFFHEIVMMNYGGRLLSREFLGRAYELCGAHDVPVVCDEIQSCLWAPGLFMFREYGLRPSFVSVGKGFPGGEYPASRLLFSAAFDCLPQFGALVTNGQEEVASLAYLVTMRWTMANAQRTREIGQYYENRVRDLVRQFPQWISGVDGWLHMTCLNFADAKTATAFARLLVERGLDVSVQTYKADCPPSLLTKLPLICGWEAVDFVVDQMKTALEKW